MTHLPLPQGHLRRAFTAAAALLGLAAAGTADAQFVFENPTPDSFQSGVTVFSGWICDADEVRIVVDKEEGPPETMIPAYGTSRNDTIGVCGDANNGFGVLVNLNRFGTGVRTAQLFIDDELVETRTFDMTRPTDQNFPTDLEGTFTIPDFPDGGDALDLVWQTGTQNFGIAPAGSGAASNLVAEADAAAVSTLFTFENPGELTFVSGVTVFSGWICDAEEVRIVVHRADGTDEILVPAYGTSRGDTLGVCGDVDNGFGVLVNSNRFGSGLRTADLYIDDELAETRSFTVTKPTDELFPTDLEGEFRLPGFPDPAQDTTVIWQTAQQNFGIKSVDPTLGPTPTPGATPTPAPTGTPSLCGNGVIDEGEECDGTNLDGEECETLYGGFDENLDDPCVGSTLSCTSECTFDGRACLCNCEEDFDCDLPEGPSHVIDCTATYCTAEICDPEDLPDCECTIEEFNFNTGCIDGRCLTTPFEGTPNELEALCFGLSYTDPDFPPCDFCEF